MFDIGSAKTSVQALPATAVSDAERIDAIRALEELKCAAEAAQASLAADFAASQEAAAEAGGVPVERRSRGLAHQIALARRESPHRGQRHLGLARILPELPATNAAFAAGRITEWRVTLIARETACLTLEHRREIDQRVAGDPDKLEAMGDVEIIADCRRLAYALDPHSFVARRRKAEADRHVSLRPAPDVMSQLSALLPVKDGVAVYASLRKAADSATATGDERSRSQIMADTLIARILGQQEGSGVSISLVVRDDILLGGVDGSAEIEGYGPVPADLARELMTAQQVWLRRLYVTPATGALVAMDSIARLVPEGIKRMVSLRDRTCRTPWCDAPIRHADHVRSVASGGETSLINTQGLCESCNLAKEATGWTAWPRPGPRHRVDIHTPTGHHYESVAPIILVA